MGFLLTIIIDIQLFNSSFNHSKNAILNKNLKATFALQVDKMTNNQFDD